MAGIYIHVPFCITKCGYCDFYSLQGTRKLPTFVRALLKEIELRAYELSTDEVQTIYLGGGTPSLLLGSDMAAIMSALRDHFKIAPNAEVTAECNPGDLSQMDIDEYLSVGVNRFSIGAQSFDPTTLKFLERRHAPKETIQMVEYFRAAGVTNLSLDLIYGIPHTTLETLHHDLDQIIALAPEHVSTYHLIYEEGTPLYVRRTLGQVRELEEGLSLQMAHTVAERLTQAGYEHYEISNFARPGFRARHNSAYWTGIPYIGFGPSAHSYRHPWRSVNPANLSQYLEGYRRPLAHFLPRTFEYITPQIAYEEYILTHLRTKLGISLTEIADHFGQKATEHAQIALTPWLKDGYIVQEGTRHILTRKGIDLSDSIITSLFY